MRRSRPLVALACLLSAAGCSSDHANGSAGTETHWFAQCTEDRECGPFSCICGRCTLSCSSTSDCDAAPREARCAKAGDATYSSMCTGDVPGLCLDAEGAGTPGDSGGAGGSDSSEPGGSGGTSRTGRAGGTGGVDGDSGSPALTGGTDGTGGTSRPGGTGSTPGSGGASSSGDATGNGGTSSTGGTPHSGGAAGTGGIQTTGGASGGGGNGTTGGAASTGAPSTGGGGTSGGADGTGGIQAAGTGGRAEAGGGVGGQGGAPTGGGAGEGGGGNQAGEPGITEPPLAQSILFEVDYTNFAWAARAEGTYVTRAGEIYDFAADAENLGTVMLRDESMTYEEISAKYLTSTLVGTVPLDELYDMHALVREAQWGALYTSGVCSDAGEMEYVGWLYDEETSSYSPVLLGVDGDTAVRNGAPAAAELLTWFVGLLGGGERMCAALDSVVCGGATCSDEPPACTGQQVPTVVDGCWGDCILPTHCESVPSRELCGTATVVVLDESDAAHCSLLRCPYEGCDTEYGCGGPDQEVSCDCAGDHICAGGRSWCGGSVATGFTCTPP